MRYKGFTLIEVLLALSILAIALTALFKASAQNIIITQRLKEKNTAHWIAMQGISMIQLGLIQVPINREITRKTTFLGEAWYWRIFLSSTPIQSIQQIKITVSKQQTGPFINPLIGFFYNASDRLHYEN